MLCYALLKFLFCVQSSEVVINTRNVFTGRSRPQWRHSDATAQCTFSLAEPAKVTNCWYSCRTAISTQLASSFVYHRPCVYGANWRGSCDLARCCSSASNYYSSTHNYTRTHTWPSAFTALHWMQGGQVRRKLSVRLSLRLSNACIV